MFINYLHTEFSTYLLISEVLYYLHMQVRKQIILIYIRDAHYSCVWSFFSFHFYLTQNETFAFLWLPCLVNDMVRIVLSSMKKSAIILMKFQLARINMYDVIIFFRNRGEDHWMLAIFLWYNHTASDTYTDTCFSHIALFFNFLDQCMAPTDLIYRLGSYEQQQRAYIYVIKRAKTKLIKRDCAFMKYYAQESIFFHRACTRWHGTRGTTMMRQGIPYNT